MYHKLKKQESFELFKLIQKHPEFLFKLSLQNIEPLFQNLPETFLVQSHRPSNTDHRSPTIDHRHNPEIPILKNQESHAVFEFRHVHDVLQEFFRFPLFQFQNVPAG